MSLYLPDQKLGSRSQEGSSSHKFMLKGRQTGSMHRGHSWVFRAESFDTMLAWYDDIKNLTEKTGEERNAFVRRHARSISAGSQKAMSVSSDGLEEDEADAVPYSANASAVNAAPPLEQPTPIRPQPGGRFPSDIQVNHNNLQSPAPPSSASSDNEHDLIAAAGVTPGGTILRHGQNDPHRGLQDKRREANPYELGPTIPTTSHETETANRPDAAKIQPSVQDSQPTQTYKIPPQDVSSNANTQPYVPAQTQAQPHPDKSFLGNRPGSGVASHQDPVRHNSLYGDWMAPVASSGAASAVDAEAYRRHQLEREEQQQQQQQHLPVDHPDAADSQSTIPIPPKSSKRDLDPLKGSRDLDTVGGSEGISGTAGGMAVATGTLEPHREAGSDDGVGARAQEVSSPTPKLPDRAMETRDASDRQAERAKKTERSAPKMLRHDTDVTISDLHVPGKFPSGSRASVSES